MSEIVKKKPNVKIFRPQPGPQELYFTRYWTNIVIYGGAVFAGKTWALCYDALRDTCHKGYEAKIFRRTFPQVIQALVPTSRELYSGVRYNSYAERPNPVFKFYGDPKKRKKRSEISFSHMQYNKTVEEHQGLQSPFIGYDELEHFSKYMFTYMLSRNRSRVTLPSSVNTQRVRASCNPLPGSWLAELLDQGGYIQNDGYPDPGMKGVVRYMYNIEDNWVFGTDPISMQNRYNMKKPPFSFTFVPGTLDDNEIGNRNNPAYESALTALSSWDYDVLVRGNWKTVKQGSIFTHDMFDLYWSDDLIEKIEISYKMIFVDTAQKLGQKNDYTVMLCVGLSKRGELVILDLLRGKMKPMEAYRKAEAFYLKHSMPNYKITDPKQGRIRNVTAAPLSAMLIEEANRGTDILLHLKDKGYNVGGIKRQGKMPVATRGKDKVARAISVLPLLEKSKILIPGGKTRWSGYDGWCNSDERIQKILISGESVCTDPDKWKLSLKSELVGFDQGETTRDKPDHDDIVDTVIDSAMSMLSASGLSWVKSMLGFGK